MKPKKQAHFYLSDEALAVIQRRAKSPNKRGDWLSQAIIEYDAILADAERLAAVPGVAALLKRLTERK